MIEMLKSLFRSFGYAWKGICRTVREERNFRIHLVAVCLVLGVAFLYEVTAGQAVILVILFALVLSFELLNTAVENAVDLMTDQRHPLAEKAKDAAAGAVLVSALAAAVSAVLIFRDLSRWTVVIEKLATPGGILSLVLFMILALLFVWAPKKRK